MHDRGVAHVALKGCQLLESVLCVLARKARKVLQAVRIIAVTAVAGRHALRLDAVLVDLTTLRYALETERALRSAFWAA
jgi:hypothetical protein